MDGGEVPAGRPLLSGVPGEPAPSSAPDAAPGAQIVQRPAGRFSGAWSQVRAWSSSAVVRDVVVPVVAIRVLLYVFAPIAVLLLGGPDARSRDFLTLWQGWDAGHYIHIASAGYDVANDPGLIAFLPFFPMLIRVVSLVLPPVIAALAVTFLATLAASVGLYRLALLDGGGRTIARGAVLALNLAPVSYSLVTPYTEAPFLALTIWSFARARAGDWTGAGVLGMAATATRLQGLILLPALGVEYLWQRRRVQPDIAWLALIPLGTAAYMLLNYLLTRDPLHFMYIENVWFSMHNGWPWDALGGLWHALTTFKLNNPDWAMLNVAPFIAYVLLAVVAAWTLVSRRSRPSYAVYAILFLLSLATLMEQISVARYALGVFPAFLAAGGLARRPSIGFPVLMASVLLLALLFARYALGQWAF